MRHCTPLALLLSASFLHAGDTWPQFRGPNGDGISDAKAVPTTWSETENVRWKVAIHDKGWSSPVVWGNQVWMTTATEDGHAYFAVCVDRTTGAIVHDLKLFTEEKPAFCHPYNSYASPTPVIEEGRVYVHFGAHGTACLDSASGKVLWQRTDLQCDHYRGPGSSPILVGKLLVLTFDGFDQQYVAALDKETGQTVWKKDRGILYTTNNGDYKKAYSTPAVLVLNGKPQLISPSAEATQAFDPATGEVLWSVHHGGMNEASRPVFGHDLIYLTSGHTANLLAVHMGGEGDVTRSGVAWKVNRSVPTRPSLLLIGELLFMVNDQGVASCLDAKTGTYLWNERVAKPCSGSPVYAAGHIYIADEEGKTHVLAADRTFKLVASNKLNAGCMASPAVAGDALFLRTKTHLYCIAAGKP